MKKIAYTPVSTSGQTLETQIHQLIEEGCDHIFKKTISGANSDRPELTNALDAHRQLRPTEQMLAGFSFA